jgi:hypothetical protein
MIAIAAVSTPIPLDRVHTTLPSPFAEPSDDAAFRPSPAAPSHRILPRIIERSLAVKTADSMIGDRVSDPLQHRQLMLEPLGVPAVEDRPGRQDLQGDRLGAPLADSSEHQPDAASGDEAVRPVGGVRFAIASSARAARPSLGRNEEAS